MCVSLSLSLSVCVFLCVTEPSVLRGALCGHSDSVWGLVYSAAHQRLLSCSGDGSLRLWDASGTGPALTTFNHSKGGLSARGGSLWKL